MAKKRRLGSSIHPTSSKMKYDSRGDDVMVARDRLKGALEGLVQSDEESSSSLEDVPVLPIKPPVPIKREVKPQLIRRRKRKVPVDEEVAFHNEFVMKLFDRSVNFARFQEDTPLYPICRAWMANLPRVAHSQHLTENQQVKEENVPESDLDSSGDVYKLPEPSGPPCVSRVPSMPRPELQGINLNYDVDNLPSVEELRKDHMVRWKQTRQKWAEMDKIIDARYQDSVKILNSMYKRYQNVISQPDGQERF